MNDDSDALRRALGDLLRLLKKAESCPTCEGPSSSFDECHEKEWEDIKRRAETLLKKKANEPN